MGIYEKMQTIQNELNVPKGQFNKFGNYKYRSCEDILQALKPHLKNTGTVINISDEIIQVIDRVYVQATVSLIDIETGEKIETKAAAREEPMKKGMDGSQITGSASSYARKYALNGLFGIDDTKDSDAMENPNNEAEIQDTGKGYQELICTLCGQAIKRNASYREDEIAELTKGRYGKEVCLKCAQKLEKENAGKAKS